MIKIHEDLLEDEVKEIANSLSEFSDKISWQKREFNERSVNFFLKIIHALEKGDISELKASEIFSYFTPYINNLFGKSLSEIIVMGNNLQDIFDDRLAQINVKRIKKKLMRLKLDWDFLEEEARI